MGAWNGEKNALNSVVSCRDVIWLMKPSPGVVFTLEPARHIGLVFAIKIASKFNNHGNHAVGGPKTIFKDRVKWSHDGLKWTQVDPSGPRVSRVNSIGHKWTQGVLLLVVLSGPRWSQVVLSGRRSPQVLDPRIPLFQTMQAIAVYLCGPK